MNEKGGNEQPQQNENREGNTKEIKYETVRRFNSKEEHVDKDKQGDERASITQVNVNEKNEESRAQSQTQNENAQSNTELIDAHLERDGTENRSGKSDAHLPSKTLNHFEVMFILPTCGKDPLGGELGMIIFAVTFSQF